MTPIAVTANLLWLRPGAVGGSENYVVGLLKALGEFAPELRMHVVATPETINKHPWLSDYTTASGHFTVTGHKIVGGRVGRFIKERRLFRAGQTSEHAFGRAFSQASTAHHLGGYIGGKIQSPRRISTERVAAEGVSAKSASTKAVATKSAPAVVTIHDTQFLDLPQNFSFIRRQFLQRAVAAATAEPNVVCAVSSFTARQLARHFDVDPQRCHVVPPVISPPQAATATITSRLALKPFVFYPAVTWPHKRHDFLVDVAERLRDKQGALKFVLCGAPGPAHNSLRKRLAGSAVADRFVHLGRVAPAELANLYRSAQAVVFPSQYEGVGLPVLEAMAHGCPVITSDHEGLLDTAADAALSLPLDAELWVEAILRLGASDEFRNHLVAQGRERAAQFTSSASAAAQMAAYRCVQ